MTQKELVYAHIKMYGEITSWDAIMMYGITRLADVIYRLKKDGHEIEAETVIKKKGERTITFAKYRFAK